MANKFTNTGNNPDLQALLDELSLEDISRLKIIKEATRRNNCHHTKLDGCELVPISQSDLPSNLKSKFSGDTVFVCGGKNGCGAIIDMRVYDNKEINNGFFMFQSILNQMQVVLGAKLDDDEQKQLVDGFVYVSYLEKLVNNVYGEMKKMNDNKGKGNKSKSGKGGIGLTQGMLHS